jgi:hypothetical protein
MNVLGGLEAALNAITADGEKTGWKNGSQSVMQSYYQLVSMIPGDSLDQFLSRYNELHAKAVGLIRAAHKLRHEFDEDELAKVEWAALATHYHLEGKLKLTEDQRKALAEDPHVGGGLGRVYLGRIVNSERDAPRRNELLALADECPLDFTAATDRMDLNADFGRDAYGNWLAH